MKTFLLVWMIIFAATGLDAAPRKHEGGEGNLINFNTPVRVLLAKGRRAIEIHALSGALYVSTGASSQWKRVGTMAKIKLNPKIPGFWIENTPYESTSLYLREQFPLGSVRVDSSVYRGTIKLEWKNDSFWVINILPVDEYLSGIVGAEMNPNWELEALRAQVVASRSYALFMIRNPKNPYYDVEATIQDQVYAGTSVESAKVREAVLSTLGEYLAVKGSPIKAFYHSRCGGRTETAQAVWNSKEEKSKKKGVKCLYCQKNPQQWSATFSLREFYRRLRLPFIDKTFRVASLERSDSGRIASLSLGPSGREHNFSSDELRSLLGYSRLKSAYFSFYVDGSEVHFSGVGAGHGVGMCQWGAKGMAQQGKTYKEILGYYYPEASLSSRRLK